MRSAARGFPASRRVLRKADFDAAYRAGRRHGNALFTLTARTNGLDHPRLGLAIAARTVGHSVARNRLRRLIRESFRLAQHRLPAADLIIGARAAARDASADRLRAGLDSLWQTIASS
ncbi:MAG: ribonuclease P protein component [Steroidobacteraceae bacterium]